MPIGKIWFRNLKIFAIIIAGIFVLFQNCGMFMGESHILTTAVPSEEPPKPPNQSGECSDSVTISNGQLTLTFDRKYSSASPELAALVLSKIASESGIEIDASRSPLWQVDLRNFYPGGRGFMGKSGGLFPNKNEPWYLPSKSVKFSECTPNSVQLEWLDIKIGDQHSFDVTIKVALQSNLNQGSQKSTWQIAINLSDESPKGIYDIKFPVLTLPPLSSTGEQDYLVMPQELGVLVQDPTHKLNLPPDDETTIPFQSPFSVPGNDAIAQFLAYYTSNPVNGGIQMTAEDLTGYYKRFFARRTKDNFLTLYFRHFPGSDYDSREIEKLKKDFRSFDLMKNAGYSVSIDLFKGDWFDAAQRYRNWLVEANAPWVKDNRLKQRSDIGGFHKYQPYTIFLNSPVRMNVDGELSGQTSEMAAVQELVSFISKNTNIAEKPSVIIQPPTLSGKMKPGCDRDGFGSDCGSCDLRDGLPNMLGEIRNEVMKSSLNRDIGHWPSISICTPPPEHTLLRNVDYSVVRPDLMHTCHSAQSVESLRKQMHDSFIKQLGSQPSDGVFLTGQGGVSQLCYGPADLANDSANHHHRVGGGTYSHTSWLAFLDWYHGELGSLNISQPSFVHEEINEQMVGYAQSLFGRSRSYPRNDVPVYSKVMTGEPVPLLSALFHDRTLIHSNTAYESEYIGFYKSEGYRLARYSAAMDVIAFGEVPTVPLVVDSFSHPIKNDLKILEKYDGRPSLRTDKALKDLKFVSKLIQMRALLAEYLIFGEMMRPPQPEVMTYTSQAFQVDGKLELRQIPNVVVGSFKAEDGTVAIILANYTHRRQSASVSFSPSDFNLDAQQTFTISRLNLKTEESKIIAEFMGSEASVKTPTIALPQFNKSSISALIIAPKHSH